LIVSTLTTWERQRPAPAASGVRHGGFRTACAPGAPQSPGWRAAARKSLRDVV